MRIVIPRRLDGIFDLKLVLLTAAT
jgi:hypothetical protein